MAKLNLATSVLFCDDVRHEQGNKTSFMGVYLDSMIVRELPFTHPHLYTVGTIIFSEPLKDVSSISMVMTTPDDQSVEIEVPIESGDSKVRFIRPIMVGRNVELKVEGEFRVHAVIDGEEYFMGVLPLKVNPEAIDNAYNYLPL